MERTAMAVLALLVVFVAYSTAQDTTEPISPKVYIVDGQWDGAATMEPIDARIVAESAIDDVKAELQALRQKVEAQTTEIHELHLAIGEPEQLPEAIEPIDPNTADKETLDKLPGIGPSYAQNIIDYRDAAEPPAFVTTSDLARVRYVTIDMALAWHDAGWLANIEKEQETQ